MFIVYMLLDSLHMCSEQAWCVSGNDQLLSVWCVYYLHVFFVTKGIL